MAGQNFTKTQPVQCTILAIGQITIAVQPLSLCDTRGFTAFVGSLRNTKSPFGKIHKFRTYLDYDINKLMKYILHSLPNRTHNPSRESKQLNTKLLTYSLLAILVFFNIGISVFLSGALNESEETTLRVMRAKEIATVSSNLSKRVYDAGVALGGLTMTKSQMFSDRFDKSIGAIPKDVTDLKDLIEQKNARQFEAFMKVVELLPDTIKYMGEVRAQILNSKETGMGRGGRGIFGRMQANAAAIQQSLQVIVDENKELANSKVPTRLINFEMIKAFLIATAFGNAILGIALAFIMRKTASS